MPQCRRFPSLDRSIACLFTWWKPASRNSPGILRYLLVVLTALGMSGAKSTRAATPQEVDAAIKKAMAFLKSQQKDGNWEGGVAPDFKKLDPKGGPTEACKYGGVTALASYALLAAGESDQNPEMAKAIKWLREAEMHGTYAVGLRSQVWNLTPESPARNAARDKDKDFLLSAMTKTGPHTGFYAYSYSGPAAPASLGEKKGPTAGIPAAGPPADGWFDRSNSQYGVLGVWALEQAGAEIPQKYWEIDRQGVEGRAGARWRLELLPATRPGTGHADRHHDRGRRRHALHHPGLHAQGDEVGAVPGRHHQRQYRKWPALHG